jgi:hypothetical protein
VISAVTGIVVCAVACGWQRHSRRCCTVMYSLQFQHESLNVRLPLTLIDIPVAVHSSVSGVLQAMPSY